MLSLLLLQIQTTAQVPTDQTVVQEALRTCKTMFVDSLAFIIGWTPYIVVGIHFCSNILLSYEVHVVFTCREHTTFNHYLYKFQVILLELYRLLSGLAHLRTMTLAYLCMGVTIFIYARTNNYYRVSIAHVLHLDQFVIDSDMYMYMYVYDVYIDVGSESGKLILWILGDKKT